MTKGEQARLTASRLKVLQQAANHQNVARVCRRFGISRKSRSTNGASTCRARGRRRMRPPCPSTCGDCATRVRVCRNEARNCRADSRRSATVPATFLAFLPRWTVASVKSSAPETGGCMSVELPIRPTCPACGSTKVGTLAKEITKDTAWRCASCGETFKALKVGLPRGA